MKFQSVIFYGAILSLSAVMALPVRREAAYEPAADTFIPYADYDSIHPIPRIRRQAKADYGSSRQIPKMSLEQEADY
ncbi:hypothetical protein BGZ80_005004, partial [Entomortierella chlamydospora]